jgi:rhodanese-related sulfurtransferase
VGCVVRWRTGCAAGWSNTSAASIVVYCKSGDRGALSAQTLLGMGYTNVSNMAGGFVAWDKAGYEVAK